MTREDALKLDAADPLARFREAFDLPPGLIYLDGNSLGPPPKAALTRLADVAKREWGQDLITSWNLNGWMEAPLRVGAKIARLVGAAPHEVAVADSTSVNLFKLAAGALSLRPGRRTLITQRDNFPTDVYVLEGLAALVPGTVLKVVDADAVPDAIDEDTAAVVLTQVHYTSARRWDMAEVAARAHAKGALTLWDLSHTAGAIACDLNGTDADLAVGCGYKHLNGGPGAPAFLYVAERHQGQIRSPLTGWMGHAAPFDFAERYQPAADIRALVSGTPGVLGLAALEAGIDLHLEADPHAVEAKGLSLQELFVSRLEARCPALRLSGPREMARRGLHAAFHHPEAYALVQALIARGVVGDFRAPDLARFGFAPLYLSHAQVWDAVEILAEVLASGAYKAAEFRQRAAVT
jgi:kynureninase